MTNTEELLRIIRESGLKLGFIAEKLGLSRFGFSKKINNETEFKASEIDALCELLHIDSYEERLKIFFAKEVDKTSTDEEQEEVKP